MQRVSYSMTFAPVGGVRIQESRAATRLPSGRPQTDDMRAMVDELEARGQIRRIPAIYQLPGGLVVMHPDIGREYRERIAADIDRQIGDMMYDAIRGGL